MFRQLRATPPKCAGVVHVLGVVKSKEDIDIKKMDHGKSSNSL
jgi:hypothetical protein